MKRNNIQMKQLIDSKKLYKEVKVFKKASLVTAVVLASGSLFAAPAPITLSGDYVKIGTNAYGTLGSYGSISPGIQYDNTGTGTFNDSYDYLTPGTPFEGYNFTVDSSGSTYSSGANNASGLGTGVTTNTFADTSVGTYNSVEWTGSYDPGTGKLFDITNTVGFDDGDKLVKITTTITAAQNLSNLYFLRVTDPDTVAAVGDSSSTTNIRGSDSIAATNLVYAEATVSKYIIGLYSDAASGVNTGVSSSWSTDPLTYYSGTDDGNGDSTIGITFSKATLVDADTVTFTYYYVFGSNIAAVVDETISGLSVAEAAQLLQNTPAYGAAKVIDATPELLALFTAAGLSGEAEISDAATQTLPLLTGGSVIAFSNSISAIKNVIQSRVSSNTGMSSGDGFIGDKHIWLKPFGAWADQNDRKGVSGYEAETVGMVFGADGELNERTRLGAAFAYANSNVDGGTSAAPQSVDAEVFQLIGYGSYSFNDSTVANFQLDFGKNNVDGNRTIDFTNTVAKSDYNSHSLHIGVGLDKGYNLGAVDTLVASVRADYTKIKDDAYNETGAGLLNLNVESNTAEIFVVGVDGTLNHSLSDKSVLQANIGLGYDLNNDDVVITAAFEGSPAASFDAQGLEQDPWIANAGLSYIHQAENGIEVQLTYDVQYREDFLNQSASLKARWAF